MVHLQYDAIMKTHRDVLSILKAKNLRLTPARRALIQYILDNKTKQISLQNINNYLEKNIEGVNRSSIYRNLELLKKLEIIQELNLPKKGKHFRYAFDNDIHHFYICKKCGKATNIEKSLYDRIEKALKSIKGFLKADMSIVFYGSCLICKESRA